MKKSKCKIVNDGCPHFWKQVEGKLFRCEMCDSEKLFPIQFDDARELAYLIIKFGDDKGYQMWLDGVKVDHLGFVHTPRNVKKQAHAFHYEGGLLND